jgi:DNA-binding GntR family transcriptional regulator
MSGTIAIGSWLRQESLAADFGVSRTPVREALRKLQASGVVEVVPHRGALVRGPTVREIREAYEVRAELEGFAAELAARWIHTEQMGRLREAEELFRKAVADLSAASKTRAGFSDETDGEPWFRANTLFHEVVQEAGRNDQLRTTIRELHRGFPRNLTWAALADSVRLLDENVAQHQRIREAIERGDGEQARREMTRHVRFAEGLVATWFERHSLRDGKPMPVHTAGR